VEPVPEQAAMPEHLAAVVMVGTFIRVVVFSVLAAAEVTSVEAPEVLPEVLVAPVAEVPPTFQVSWDLLP
jgi:hypothetical protein